MAFQDIFSLESLIGPVNSDAVHDPFFVSGKALSWVSTSGDVEALCRLLSSEGGEAASGLPSKTKLALVGGYEAHLRVAVHGQGIPVGEVHAEIGVGREHMPVTYTNRDIIECRGLKSDGQPSYRKPPALKNLSCGNLFEMSFKRSKLKYGYLDATVTNGTKTVRNGNDELVLEYEIGTEMIKLDENGVPQTKRPPAVLSVSAQVKAGPLSYKLSFQLTEAHPFIYRGSLASDVGLEITFDSDGQVGSMMSRKSTGERISHHPENYESIFYSGFDARRKAVPNIDVPQTMRRMFLFSANPPSPFPPSF